MNDLMIIFVCYGIFCIGMLVFVGWIHIANPPPDFIEIEKQVRKEQVLELADLKIKLDAIHEKYHPTAERLK